ncbi:MAG: hypothetical protein KF737_11905 [Phenylobacterium sp.]|nr:hypothetical protein [Phenylobacterium sp.]
MVKQPSDTARFRNEIRKAVRPLMTSWGFDNPPKGTPDWWGAPRINNWIRERDGYTDQIFFTWDRYGRPKFALDLRTDQLERMLRPDQSPTTAKGHIVDVILLDRRPWLFGGLLRFEWTSGRRSLRREIRHLERRLRDANHFLLTGEIRSRLILRKGAVGDGVLTPVFWMQQGEERELALQHQEELRRRLAEKRRFRASGSKRPTSPES